MDGNKVRPKKQNWKIVISITEKWKVSWSNFEKQITRGLWLYVITRVAKLK